jgi:hypothetical protein
VKPLAKQGAACRTSDDGNGIVMGKLAPKGRAARPQPHISGGSGDSGAAREQTRGTGKREQLNK